jgi:hypothetical protein
MLIDFLNDYGYVDPRVVYARASTATSADRSGILRTRSANNPRFSFQPSTGYPRGFIADAADTNSFLWSEDFTNAAWAKNACTITSNAVVAPDGNTTGDLMTSTGANGWVGQDVTFAAGSTLVISVFAQKAVSNFFRIVVIDAVGNNAAQWFNLNLGTLGSHTSGLNTVLYSAGFIEPWPNGWYRCTLTVTTTTITTLNVVYLSPVAIDVGTAVNGDSVNLWGAMLSAQPGVGAYGRLSSYISTATAAVTRAGDSMQLALPDTSWFDPTRGTLFADFVINLGAGQNGAWLCGPGNTVNDFIAIGFTISADLTVRGLWGNIQAAGVSTLVSDSAALTAFEQPLRVAVGYRQADVMTLCVNGRPVQQSAVPASWPAAPVRMAIGGQPFSPGGSGTTFKRFAYFPRKLTNTQLIDLTT